MRNFDFVDHQYGKTQANILRDINLQSYYGSDMRKRLQRSCKGERLIRKKSFCFVWQASGDLLWSDKRVIFPLSFLILIGWRSVYC